MKTTNKLKIKIALLVAMISLFGTLKAQSPSNKIGIIKIESRGWKEEQPFTQLVRIELGKLNLFEVLDRYDIENAMKKNNINSTDCLNKDCILEAGKNLNADYMLSGSIEKLNNKILIMFRELEIKSGNTLKTITKEFPDGEKEPEVLIEVSLKEMFGIKIDDENKQTLDKKNQIANAVNNAKETTISIGGPRFGFAFLTGDAAEFIIRSKEQGGFNGYPALFQFGYQFEKMYLNEGNLQALFEFLPTISGVDQGHFIPSFTLLNGFRSSKNGWEFAFGPTITWTSSADMYKENGEWKFVKNYNGMDSLGIYHPLQYDVVNRGHTGGDLTAKPGLLIGFGKTFKSGKLNMPLNVYMIPRKNAVQFGISYGFNTMRNSRNK